MIARLPGGEPHLVTARRPGQPLGAGPLARQLSPRAGQVHDGDHAADGGLRAILEESHPLAVARDPRVVDRPRRFIQHVAGRVLEPARTRRPAAHDGELRFAGRPVGVHHVFEQLAGSATAEGGHRQRADRPPFTRLALPHEESQLTGLRRQHVRGQVTERPRLRAAG